MSADVLALRHVAFEGPGLIAPLVAERGGAVRIVDVPVAGLPDGDALDADLLVVLGGPVGAYETTDYPFLAEEQRLLERRLAAGRPTLGICLGAQLMARALGARVYGAPAKEIGWAPLTLTEAGHDSVLAPLAQDEGVVLHWHGDTFDLPDGAERLASTALCPNQAFRIGTHALALQFHLEVEARDLEGWFVGHTMEIAQAPGVSVTGLRADTARYGAGTADRGRAVLRQWFDQIGL